MDMQQEYESNAERLNDIRSHNPQSYHLNSEYKALVGRQRELEVALYPSGEDETNAVNPAPTGEWEYKTERLQPEDDDFELWLNIRGGDRWELVTIHDGRYDWIGVFKRPRLA